jgi:hypothetical protein
MGTRRFERLERERAADAGSSGAAPRPSTVESRFGDPTAADPAPAPERSGAEGARFEEAADEGRLRVRDDADHGLSFVRCALCRADNYATAACCSNCEADLTTPDQRAFNQALWRKHVADKEEEDREVEAVRERRAAAEREQADAMRQRESLERDLERRRELGLPLDDQDDVSDPMRAGARSLGALIGRAIARWLPNRTTRFAVFGAVGLAAILLLIQFPQLLVGVVWLALVLAGLARRSRRRRF